jgi:stage III sporulation protein AE
MLVLLLLIWPAFSANAAPVLPATDESAAFDLDAQLDALGRDELLRNTPQGARRLMREAGADKLSAAEMLKLSPGDFFGAVWRMFLDELQKPLRTLAAVVGMIVLVSLVGALKTAESEDTISRTFTLVAILCVVTAVMAPIIECITATARLIEDAALFMLTYIPIFSAAVAAAGAPATGATYNMFLFATCQVVSQVLANTLVPLMGVYLALCVAGSLVPELNIASATAAVKTIVSWSLGFVLTLFAALLSVQTMVSVSADSVTVRAAKFVVGSFVPVVGAALSEAYSAAQGCLRLIKTTVGAYGILAAAFTFLPVLVRVLMWQLVARAAVVAGDILGAPRVSALLRACSSALAILTAVILCFALFIIVSTAIVMAAGAGA